MIFHLAFIGFIKNVSTLAHCVIVPGYLCQQHLVFPCIASAMQYWFIERDNILKAWLDVSFSKKLVHVISWLTVLTTVLPKHKHVLKFIILIWKRYKLKYNYFAACVWLFEFGKDDYIMCRISNYEIHLVNSCSTISLFILLLKTQHN
jgi:hypothetical protein